MKNENLTKTENQTKIPWDKIQMEMKNKFGNDIYESWLKKINFEDEFNNYILLSVTTRFIDSLPVVLSVGIVIIIIGRRKI